MRKNSLLPIAIFIVILLITIALVVIKRNQPGSLNSKAAGETIDTLDYFIRDNPSQNLQTSRGENLSEVVHGNASYYVKNSSWSYEYHTWDDNYIYLRQDSGSQPYTFSPGLWLKRHMQIGETIDMTTNSMTRVKLHDCSLVSKGTFSYKMTLEQHIPNWNAGGDLGVQDVIVVHYDYGDNSERYYYSKHYGWINWQLWDDKTNTMLVESRFTTKSGQVLMPQTDCGTPQPPANSNPPPPPPTINKSCYDSCFGSTGNSSGCTAICNNKPECWSECNVKNATCLNSCLHPTSPPPPTPTPPPPNPPPPPTNNSDDASFCQGRSDRGSCYDCNGDGTVNILDFSCFSKNFNKQI